MKYPSDCPVFRCKDDGTICTAEPIVYDGYGLLDSRSLKLHLSKQELQQSHGVAWEDIEFLEPLTKAARDMLDALRVHAELDPRRWTDATLAPSIDEEVAILLPKEFKSVTDSGLTGRALTEREQQLFDRIQALQLWS